MSSLIDNRKRFPLCLKREQILQKMFPGYQRLVIKHDFSALGYSGSWVYLVHPFKQNGLSELPVVVKIASISLIQKEWIAYQEYVRNQWLAIADLRDQPVFLEDDHLGGLCYQFVGGNVFRLESLRDYCLNGQVDDINFVLTKRLFEMIKQRVLYPSRIEFDFPLQANYDMVLPVNLLIEPEAIPAGEEHIVITPDNLPSEPLEVGDYVRLEGFVITKVDLRYPSVTLNLPTNSPYDRYRVRIQSLHGLEACRFKEQLPHVEGVVVETRDSRLAEEVAKIGINDPACKTIELPDGSQLANPLLFIASILQKSRHLRFNTIHGDLNLENVLVDPAVRDVSLIDFSEARWGYVLHDFLHLEMEVITKLLPTALNEANLPPEQIREFYQQLHCVTFAPDHIQPLMPELAHNALQKPFVILTAIRKAAREGLYDRNDFSEYYEGLMLYLVGAVRFDNLNNHNNQESQPPLSKQLVLWGAATIHELMNSPTCNQEPLPESASDDVKIKLLHDRPLYNKFRSVVKYSGYFIYAVTFLLTLLLITYLLFSPESTAKYDSGDLNN